MVTYLYDGSFEGLLTILYHCFKSEGPEAICRIDDFSPDLFSKPRHIQTDSSLAGKVYSAVEKQISVQSLRHIYYAHLSEKSGVELQIYRYIKLGWKLGWQLDDHLGCDEVAAIHTISRRVDGERYRFLGLLRFRELVGDVLYGPCEPDYNVVSLLASHFQKRMANYRWIIHDVKRDIACVYDTTEWRICDFVFDDIPHWSEGEAAYQRLWQEFYQSIAIKNRTNHRLRQQFMPKKYWKYLLELDD